MTGNAVGANFQRFTIDWAPGLDATSGWQTTGVTLIGGGTAPVVGGTLASWDTSSVATAGYYTIRLTVNAANITRQVVTIVYLEPSLLSYNWPQFVATGPALNAGVVPALNADGTFRLLMEGPKGPSAGTSEFWSFGLSGPPQATPQSGAGGFMLTDRHAPFEGKWSRTSCDYRFQP